ncbi:unnamed protein product [Cyclocybe aegerita]|uniref:Uncharacterized protein n=1 Tax=Cyclocybe aegerita TaxID=1973307 RepID=A0A8S0X6A0_CYCAE|nr:unnamed protein product [Cyclocybe aegerita]
MSVLREYDPETVKTFPIPNQSVASSVSCTESERTERRHFSNELCFITKKFDHGLKKAHWINAVRKSKPDKVAVEAFLQQLGTVERKFHLNSASNLSPPQVDATLHYTLDELGFFAITCSKDTLHALSDLLDAENRQFDVRGGNYTRYFNRREQPFTNATYGMVLLHPDHFLPRGQILTVYTQDVHKCFHPTHYAPSPDGALRDTATSSHPSSFTSPVQTGGPVLVDDNNTYHAAADTSQRLPPFPAAIRRIVPVDQVPLSLNPFLVILNADMAFRRYLRIPQYEGQQHLCAEYQELVELTGSVADKIYYRRIVSDAFRHSQIVRKAVVADENADMAAAENTDVAMGGVDEHGRLSGQSQSQSLTPKGRGQGGGRQGGGKQGALRNSRFGLEVAEPGPDASDEQIRDYCCYLISGRDQPLSHKEQVFVSSLGLHPGAADQNPEDEESYSEDYFGIEDDEDDEEEEVQEGPESYFQAAVADKVLQWQNPGGVVSV